MVESIALLFRAVHALFAPSLLNLELGASAAQPAVGSTAVFALGLLTVGAAVIALSVLCARLATAGAQSRPVQTHAAWRAASAATALSALSDPDAAGKPRPRAPGFALLAA